MEYKYIKVHLHGGGTYVQEFNKLLDALDGDLDGARPGEPRTFTLEPVDMTDEEVEALPEFMGH